MQRLTLSSIWALLAAFEDPLPVSSVKQANTFEGAFVTGVDSVSWIANNTKKLLGPESCGPYCWTILSTAVFGKKNKVPQVRLILSFLRLLIFFFHLVEYRNQSVDVLIFMTQLRFHWGWGRGRGVLDLGYKLQI